MSANKVANKALACIFTFFIGVVVCPIVLLTFINHQTTAHPFNTSLLPQVKLGDVILREGTSADSDIIMILSKSKYSHVGIVTEIYPEIEVTHATTDDDPEHPNQVITSKLSDFWSDELANAGAIVRYDFMTPSDAVKVAHDVKAKLGNNFNLNPLDKDHPDPLYCSTLVYGAIKHVNQKFDLPLSNVNVPLVSGKYIFPQSFLDNEHSKVIYAFDSLKGRKAQRDID